MMNLLLVEENSALRDRWTENLRQAGHRVFAFSEPSAALVVAESTAFDVGILSFKDPTLCATLQASLKTRNPSCQITLLSERPQDEHYARALESGARSVLLKPLDPGALESVVQRADRSRRKKTVQAPDATALSALIGECPRMTQVIQVIRKVASVPSTSVLVTGESGTGKELVARAIHGLSPRADEAFVEVNCAAIPEQLLESELFGHERGAFTDATRMKPGLFELADRGTLFLDEIGEMGLELQAKLLRVLDTGAIRRIAGQEKIQLDVRVIAATNRDLPAEVKSGGFRNDLYHRLDVVHIDVPPLRERGAGDIRLLADFFLGRFARKFGKDKMMFHEDVLASLERYPWPGNVRELMNQIERAVLLSRSHWLKPEDFPLVTTGAGVSEVVAIQPGSVSVDFSQGPVPLEHIEREIVIQALEVADWNISEAARLLKIGRGALRYKMEHHQIQRQALAS
jgi:DNA-binding NtrC family response regulator